MCVFAAWAPHLPADPEWFDWGRWGGSEVRSDRAEEDGSSRATGPDCTCQHIWGKVCKHSLIQAFLRVRVLAERYFPVNPSVTDRPQGWGTRSNCNNCRLCWIVSICFPPIMSAVPEVGFIKDLLRCNACNNSTPLKLGSHVLDFHSYSCLLLLEFLCLSALIKVGFSFLNFNNTISFNSPLIVPYLCVHGTLMMWWKSLL